MAELTITGMRVVLEVARQGSFSGAATVLGYTQSAVSRQVAATEAATDAVLFERLPRGVRPTAAGEVLIRRADRALAEVDGALQEVAGVRDRLAGRLVASAFPTAAAVLLPRAIARLCDRHPELRVDLQEAPSPAQLRRLRIGRVEVAVIAGGHGLPEHDLTGLRVEALQIPRGPGIAVGRHHHFARRDSVDVTELAGQVWVVGAAAAGEPQFGPWPGLTDPHVGYAVRTWATRFGLVAAGLGITVVPGLAADSVPHDVHWVPVHDPTPAPGRHVLAITAQNPSHSAAALVTAIRHETTQLVIP